MLRISPISFFLLVRCIFPIIWSIYNLFQNEFTSDIKYLIFLHLFYLILQTCCILFLFYKLNKFKQNYIINNTLKSVVKQHTIFNYSIIFIVLFLIYSNGAALFLEGGSDAIVMMGETNKNSTWIITGIISALQIILIFTNFFEKKKNHKVIINILIFFTFLLNGKKAAILDFITIYSLIYFLLSDKKIKINFRLLSLILIISYFAITFAVFQFFRTIGVEFNLNNYINGIKYMSELIYGSFTAYLDQIIQLGGINSIKYYSSSLGSLGFIKYFLNSFTQLLFGYGIQNSIGPHLTYYIYGSSFPNGVNPTLFFEFIFIFGNFNASYFTFILMPLCFFIIYKKLVFTFKFASRNIIKSSFNFSIALFFLTFLLDSLNAIRSLPFLIIYYFLSKIINIKFK